MTYHLWAITSSASAWSKTQAWFSTLCSNLNVACVSQFRAMLECYQLLEYHSLTCDAEVSGHCKCMFMCFPLQQGFSTQCYWHFGLDIFVFEVFLFIIGSLAVPWPPTRCQDHSLACDNQRCFQMLSNFPRRWGLDSKTALSKNQWEGLQISKH